MDSRRDVPFWTVSQKTLGYAGGAEVVAVPTPARYHAAGWLARAGIWKMAMALLPIIPGLHGNETV